VDVETIDHFIAAAKNLTSVDERRVHMGGWSNGAAMALQYAIQTPGIASAAVYSAPDPERDANDPCAQIPNPLYNTPTLDVHNYCDIIGICTTGLYYYQDLAYRYPTLTQEFVVIDDTTQQIVGYNGGATCDPACAVGNVYSVGTAAHLRWPNLQNQLFFNWYITHPMPVDSKGNIEQYAKLSNGLPINYPAGPAGPAPILPIPLPPLSIPAVPKLNVP
jgi:pimeloyl-ACP methyl ester carboxylesterase